MKYWVMSVKGAQNAPQTAEAALNRQEIPEDVNPSVGDSVFVFVGKPFGAIRFRAVVSEMTGGGRPVFRVEEEYRLSSALRAPRIFLHGFNGATHRMFEIREDFAQYVKTASGWSKAEDAAAAEADKMKGEAVKREFLDALVGTFVIRRRDRIMDPWEYLVRRYFDLPDKTWSTQLYRACPFKTREEAEEYIRDVYGDHPQLVLNDYQVIEVRNSLVASV